MNLDKVLTAGEWEALLCQTPDQVRPFVYRLAIHHGVVERPLCDGNSGEQGVLKYGPVLPDGPGTSASHAGAAVTPDRNGLR